MCDKAETPYSQFNRYPTSSSNLDAFHSSSDLPKSSLKSKSEIKSFVSNNLNYSECDQTVRWPSMLVLSQSIKTPTFTPFHLSTFDPVKILLPWVVQFKCFPSYLLTTAYDFKNNTNIKDVSSNYTNDKFKLIFRNIFVNFLLIGLCRPSPSCKNFVPFSILLLFYFFNLFAFLPQTFALRVPYRTSRYPPFYNEYPHQPGGPLPNEVYNVELFPRENAKSHRTSYYDMLDNQRSSLIIRRGDPFFIALNLKKIYEPSRDKIRLEFMYGPRPTLGKGTLIYLPVTSNREFTKDKSKWDARMHSAEGNRVHVQIHVPANVAVAVWRLRVSTKQQGSRNIKSFDVKENIYVLFNAWSKDDPVYMDNESRKREYILNDVGKIYIGSYSKPKGRRWIYGQFNEAVLPAIMFMMEKSRLDYTARANPIKVVRAVAAMVNSHDDNGLLVGNWSGSYESGTPPWQWTGSAGILEQYLRTKGDPVKFGQCWVFAGVTTTVCRALGIPARTVTNFVSAHDTDDSLTVDKFFDKQGETITDVNSDSIWNFHVWTDCWMARTDLPPGYGGWQVIDATPQETSEGLYRTGPASVESVRKGEINFAYDSPFVFAEVNADVVHWQLDEASSLGWKKIKTNKYHVGRKLVSKRIGYDDDSPGGFGDAEDITAQYKNKEGTEEERMAVLNAARCIGLSFLFELPEPGKEDVDFDLLDIEKVLIGQPFFVTVQMINRSPQRRTISLSLTANSVHYTGILARAIRRERQTYLLNPRQKEIFRLRISAEEYLDKLVDYAMIKIYAVATVKETSQTWSEEDDFAVEKPALYLSVNGPTQVGLHFGLEIKFTNPLNKYLTRCKLTIEGPGLTRPITVAIRDIQPKETITHVESLVPRKPGPRNVVVVFQSLELVDVVGSKQIEVFG